MKLKPKPVERAASGAERRSEAALEKPYPIIRHHFQPPVVPDRAQS